MALLVCYTLVIVRVPWICSPARLFQTTRFVTEASRSESAWIFRLGRARYLGLQLAILHPTASALKFPPVSRCLLITNEANVSQCRSSGAAALVRAHFGPQWIACVLKALRRRRATLRPMDAHEHCRAAALEAWQREGTSTHHRHSVRTRGRRADEGPSGHLVACPPHGKLPTRRQQAPVVEASSRRRATPHTPPQAPAPTLTRPLRAQIL